MKILFYFLFGVIMFYAAGIQANTKNKFDTNFFDETMRIDYYHIGDSKSEIFTIDHIYRYGKWAGSQKNLIDKFNNGRYYTFIYDLNSNELIYSKGYDSYFGEYKTSTPAIEGKKRTYHESILIPFPKNKVKLVISHRNQDNILQELFRTEINPFDVNIIFDQVKDESVTVIKSVYNGDPHHKVDVAIIGEGYTLVEQEKFANDLQRFTNVFFKQEPYKTFKNNFNIYGVFKPSQDSGADEPRSGIFKNTNLNATFNSLGSERYLLTEDNKSLRDIAAHVPYDALYIMVNHKRYGGGGIYNLFCTFTTDNQWFEYLFLHEFGHSFAGLADEYYTSSIAYNDFYKKGVEPVEPNITALLEPENIKWKDLMTKGIDIPTPWEKDDYDKMDYEWQKKRREMNNHIAILKKSSASAKEITRAEEEYVKKDREQAVKKDRYLSKSKFRNIVGAFEGAGYSAKGMYRPMLDCIMFSQGDKPFCKVCERRIIEVIQYYSE